MPTINLSSVEDDGTIIDYSFEPKTWFHALDHFVKFLRAQGYSIQNDSVVANTPYLDEDLMWDLNNIGIVNMDNLVNKESI